MEPLPQLFDESLPAILQNLPEEWLGTTFKNDSHYVGREKFVENLFQLIQRKHSATSESQGSHALSISAAELEAVGNAEDYLRVASNPSTLLEAALGLRHGYSISHVYSFASATMPLLSVLYATPRDTPVHVYGARDPFTLSQRDLLRRLNLHCNYAGATLPAVRPTENIVVLALTAPPLRASSSTTAQSGGTSQASELVDGYCHQGVLYINSARINHAEILVRRKRMSKPETTPQCLARLRVLAGLQDESSLEAPYPEEAAHYLAVGNHLKQLSGVVDPNDPTEAFLSVTGLAALAVFHTTMITSFGGADTVCCSTGYGGSDKLASIMEERSPGQFRKHSYDIQGSLDLTESISNKLDELMGETRRDALLDNTVVIIEIPTNPDMKVPQLPVLVAKCQDYQRVTGKKLILLIDTTFSPSSQIIQQIHDIDATLPVVVFISLSKSVSGGRTTGGALVANHTELSQNILKKSYELAELLDTKSKPDQIQILHQMHAGTENRIDLSYINALKAVDILDQQILQYTPEKMFIHFVTAEQAARKIKPATFSFNLPIPKWAQTPEEIQQLPQQFVDVLCENAAFKPCVSFGQDVSRVYATVPATSTQGDIKQEDKAKQAVGGVQLVRLSFPAVVDMTEVENAIRSGIKFHFTRTK